MEHRAQQHHRERLADAMRDEISAIVEGELADPRIGLATVTNVEIVPDGKSAIVGISVAEAEEEKDTLAGLEATRASSSTNSSSACACVTHQSCIFVSTTPSNTRAASTHSSNA